MHRIELNFLKNHIYIFIHSIYYILQICLKETNTACMYRVMETTYIVISKILSADLHGVYKVYTLFSGFTAFVHSFTYYFCAVVFKSVSFVYLFY